MTQPFGSTAVASQLWTQMRRVTKPACVAKGLVCNQSSIDSERLTSVGPLFNVEDLLADTEGGGISEKGVNVTMVEMKRTD